MADATITGLDEVIAKLNHLDASLKAQFRADAPDISAPFIQNAMIYPPERDNQRYVRTYNLQAGWRNSEATILDGGPGLTIRRENPVEYAEEVQSKDQQTFFFADRWTPLETIAQAVEAPTIDAVMQSIVTVLNKEF